MIEIQGKKILRDRLPAGTIEGTHIRDTDYTNLGYWEGDTVYDPARSKLGYLEGAYFYDPASRSKYVSLTDMEKKYVKGEAEPIVRCAVYALMGA